MFTYNELSRYASDVIRADLVAKSIAITPKMEAFLDILTRNPECWRGVFDGINAWLPTASTAEVASFWQSIIKVCNADGRPYAAYPILHVQQNNAEALKVLWDTLPADALPSLREALAANPLVAALPEAKASWPKVSEGMKKLSLHAVPTPVEHQEMLAIVHKRVPHLSEDAKSDLAWKALAVLQEQQHKGQTKLHGAKMAIGRSYSRPRS